MLVFAEEGIRPTTFNPNPNIPGNNRRERRMFKEVVGALDGTLIHAYVPFHKKNVYRARGRGTTHDARILNEALEDPIYEFSIPLEIFKFEIVIYCHTCGFMAPYRNVSNMHVNENVRDDNDGDVVHPIGSEADQQYMMNLRDDIAAQIMQSH
ncbi:hypothetical protein Tco_1395395, partial [Tanacetum coccineum]